MERDHLVNLTRSVLIISADMAPTGQMKTDAARNLRGAALRMAALCGEVDLPVTWGVEEPGQDSFASELSIGKRHEIALLASSPWCGPGVGRRRFSRELSRLVAESSQSGVNLTSILAGSAIEAEKSELLIKYGFNAVRQQEPSRVEKPGPRPLRFGLWTLPADVCWNRDGSQTSTPAKRPKKSPLRDASKKARYRHLQVDLGALVEGGEPMWRSLTQWLRRGAELRDQERLEPLTMSGLVEWLSHSRRAAPQRSILRAAG